jgi:hypothetical protein
MKTITWLVLTMATSLLAQAAEKAPRPPRPPTPPAEVEAFEMNALLSGPRAGGANSGTLVVPEKPEVTALRDTAEDLAVMARILNKAVNGGGAGKTAMGIAIQGSLFGGSSGVQNMYLEGFGALFVLGVNYPLLAPDEKPVEPEATDKTSAEWEEARREVFQSATPSITVPNVFAFSSGASEPHDSEKVREMKASLLEAMKNAVHIRSLKADEWVVVVVNGRAARNDSRIMLRRAPGHEQNMAVTTAAAGQGTANRLILRVRKSDIEAFQKGKLTEEQFGKKVSEMLF